ncbi:MAG: phage minor capsid protein [bacterium]|mgnify:CR=1 FL=1|nr:phage minor capsid protein [bacterium]
MFAGITKKDTTALIRIYKEAEQDIIAKIAKTDFLKRADKEKTLKQIQNILAGLYEPTQTSIFEGTKSEYDSGVKEVQKALEKVDFKGGFSLVDKKATQFVLENLKDIQETAFNDVKQVLSNSYLNIQSSLNLISRQVKNEQATEIANQLTNKIARGQVLGTSRKQISKRLADLLTEKGITGFNYVTEKGGQRNLSLSAYVEGLTRQTLINSRASAVVSTALEMGQDLLKISTHSNPSPMCSPWGGKIISITGKTPGYPLLSEALFNGDYKRGGIHWRFCRHSLTIYIKTNIQFN